MTARSSALMPSLLVAATLAGVLFAAVPSAEAKGSSWIITGGELGDYAMMFYPEAAGEEGIRVTSDKPVNVYDEPGPGYDIYADGWLSPEYYEQVTRYHPDVGLLYGHPGGNPADRWMRPDEATRSMLNRAIHEAKQKMAAGELEQGVVAAAFRARGMDLAVYTFLPYRPSTSGDLPFFGVGSWRGAEEFAMTHLAATLENAMSGQTAEVPHYRVTVQGRGWSGGSFYYSLPEGDHSGRLFPANSWGFEKDNTYYRNTYYETTPGFDALIQAIIDGELADRATSEQHAATPTVPARTASSEHWLGRELPTPRPDIHPASPLVTAPEDGMPRLGLLLVLGIVGASGLAFAAWPARWRRR
jgi:hypothetical protein